MVSCHQTVLCHHYRFRRYRREKQKASCLPCVDRYPAPVLSFSSLPRRSHFSSVIDSGQKRPVVSSSASLPFFLPGYSCHRFAQKDGFPGWLSRPGISAAIRFARVVVCSCRAPWILSGYGHVPSSSPLRLVLESPNSRAFFSRMAQLRFGLRPNPAQEGIPPLTPVPPLAARSSAWRSIG